MYGRVLCEHGSKKTTKNTMNALFYVGIIYCRIFQQSFESIYQKV